MGKNNIFRVMAGKYRGRSFRFVAMPELRPTPNKVRETLFNWLQFDIANTSCLDLFSGSGALSFEALSRGAANVLSVEKNLYAYQAIKQNAATLSSNRLQVVHADAFDFLQNNTKTFDLILLDPPFQQDLIKKTLKILAKTTPPSTKIYIESEFKITENICSAPIQILKQKQSASVHYCLCKLT